MCVLYDAAFRDILNSALVAYYRDGVVVRVLYATRNLRALRASSQHTVFSCSTVNVVTTEEKS